MIESCGGEKKLDSAVSGREETIIACAYGKEKLTFEYISCATVSESSQWQTMSALKRMWR